MRIFLISLWNTFFTKSSIKTIENKKLAVSYESRFFKRFVRWSLLKETSFCDSVLGEIHLSKGSKKFIARNERENFSPGLFLEYVTLDFLSIAYDQKVLLFLSAVSCMTVLSLKDTFLSGWN